MKDHDLMHHKWPTGLDHGSFVVFICSTLEIHWVLERILSRKRASKCDRNEDESF